MRLLKQNTATNVMVFMSDTLDHTSGKAGLTLVITASKDGSAFNSIAPTITDLGNGWYNLALTEAMADTLGDLAFHITAPGADATDFLCRVVAGSLDADITSRLSGAGYTSPDNSGIADIKAKTDNLPANPASEESINSIPTNPLLANDTRLNNLDDTISSRSDITPTDIRKELSVELAKVGNIETKVNTLDNYDDSDIITILEFLRKITGNDVLKVDNIITIYDDNGDIWKQYDISNGGRVLQ